MSQTQKVLLLIILLGVLAYASYKTFWPEPGSAEEAAAALASCPNGTMACPNNCLKREAEGWRSMHVDGHPDTDIWMQFVDARGGVSAFNQHHIGHVIEPVNGVFTDKGVCPVCRGKGLVCR
jgi:hypothetical protein